MKQILVSEELLRNMADALNFFASEMTVGQRYTDHGQTALDAPGEIDKLLEQPSSGADWWRLKLPGGRHTDDFESARVGDYNRGWNDYRKAAKAALSALEQPAVQEPDVDYRSMYLKVRDELAEAQQRLDTCEALARSVMTDQVGRA